MFLWSGLLTVMLGRAFPPCSDEVAFVPASSSPDSGHRVDGSVEGPKVACGRPDIGGGINASGASTLPGQASYNVALRVAPA